MTNWASENVNFEKEHIYMRFFVAVTVLAVTVIERKHGINFFVIFCWVSVLLPQEAYPVITANQNPPTFLFPAKIVYASSFN